MKPAAIGATLLLHTATVGALIHLMPGQPTARPGHPIEVVMLSGAVSEASVRHAAGESAVLPDKLSRAQNQTRRPEPGQPRTPDTATQPTTSTPDISPTVSTVAVASSGAPHKSGVSIPAEFVASNAKPVYPMLSRRQEEQGTVQLHILVKADGMPGEVRVRQSSGYPLLDESALIAVRNWRFHPASVNNKPVTEWYQLAIPFKLHD